MRAPVNDLKRQRYESKKTNYLDSIKDRYALEPEDLTVLPLLRHQSRENKREVFHRMTGSIDPPGGLRYALPVPADYGRDKMQELLSTLVSALEDSHSSTALIDFVSNVARPLVLSDGRLTYDIVNNVAIVNKQQMKVSKLLIKAIDEGGGLDGVDLSGVRRYLEHLPEQPNTQVFVQNLMQYASAFKVNAELSCEFDDFANASETGAFGACYRVGDVHERAPFTLAMTPNVVLLRLLDNKRKLVGRTWCLADPDKKALVCFGCYGIKDVSILKTWLTHIASNLGYENYKVLSIPASAVDCRREKGEDGVVGIRATGTNFERYAMRCDPAIYALVTKECETVNMKVVHMPCPVCGGHGPESTSQVICEECSKQDPISELSGLPLVTGRFRMYFPNKV